MDKLAHNDIVNQIDITGLQAALNLTQIWLQDLDDHDLALSLPLAEAGLDCPECGQTFRHLYTLRRHELYTHGIDPTAGPELDIARDAVDGRPLCRHCAETFISWRCPSFDSSKAPPEQLQAHRRQLLAYHDQGDLRPLRQDRELCYFLCQRCILGGFGQPDFITLMHTIS